jgi:hypothetical protein
LSKTDKERILKALISYAKELRQDKTGDIKEYNMIEINETKKLYKKLGGDCWMLD